MARRPTYEDGRAFERAAFLQEIRRLKAVCDRSALIQRGTLMCIETWLLERTAEAEAGNVAKTIEKQS